MLRKSLRSVMPKPSRATAPMSTNDHSCETSGTPGAVSNHWKAAKASR
jgi:hypothetical protein